MLLFFKQQSTGSWRKLTLSSRYLHFPATLHFLLGCVSAYQWTEPKPVPLYNSVGHQLDRIPIHSGVKLQPVEVVDYTSLTVLLTLLKLLRYISLLLFMLLLNTQSVIFASISTTYIILARGWHVITGAHKRKERSTPIARVVISKRKLRRLARSKNFPIWKFFCMRPPANRQLLRHEQLFTSSIQRRLWPCCT